jgi:hypothetical protein
VTEIAGERGHLGLVAVAYEERGAAGKNDHPEEHGDGTHVADRVHDVGNPSHRPAGRLFAAKLRSKWRAHQP